MKIKNVLISQPQPADIEKTPYKDLILKYKLNIEFNKFFKIEGVTSKEFRQFRINILDYTAVVFTSKNSVDHFFRIAKELRIIVPETMKYFCNTEQTAYYLQNYIQYRKRKIFHSNTCFDSLITLLKKHRAEKFLLPCSNLPNTSITSVFDANQINYAKAIFYTSVHNDMSALEIDKYDLFVFFSPQGIASLFQNFPNFVQGTKLLAALGATTSQCIRDMGLRLDIEAPTPQAPSIAMAIEQYIIKSEKEDRKKTTHDDAPPVAPVVAPIITQKPIVIEKPTIKSKPVTETKPIVIAQTPKSAAKTKSKPVTVKAVTPKKADKKINPKAVTPKKVIAKKPAPKKKIAVKPAKKVVAKVVKKVTTVVKPAKKVVTKTKKQIIIPKKIAKKKVVSKPIKATKPVVKTSKAKVVKKVAKKAIIKTKSKKK